MADTSVRTYKPSPNSIVFRTHGVWSASEFSRFITAVERLYEAFLTVHLVRRSVPRMEEQVAKSLQWWNEHYSEIQDLYKTWSDRPQEVNFGHQIVPSDFLYTLAIQESSYLAFVHNHIRSVAPEHQLTIGAVRIGSLGFFSFQGLGEVIQQVREFIKDIKYRNKQEENLGKLKVAREHMQFINEYGFDPLAGPANQIPLAAIEGSDVLEQLESAGKLEDIAENIDPEMYDPGAEHD